MAKAFGSTKFPGDITCGETPDPFPNSEAKLVRPMVVLSGESRYRQELWGRLVYTNRPLLFYCFDTD